MPRTVKVPPQFAAVFEQAEKRLNPFFRDFRKVPTKGSIEISGERFVLIRGAALSVEFFEIIKNIFAQSEQEAASIASLVLFDIAHALGKADAKHFHELLKLRDPISKLSAGPIFFAHGGWAFVDISEESTPVPSEDYFLLYDHPYSFEADAWVRAGRRTEFPVCLMNCGYSSGWCEESFGVPLVAKEIDCRAKGDEVCRFIMAPPSRIDEHISRYCANSLRRAEKSPHPDVWRSFGRDWTKEALLEKSLRNTVNDYRALFDNSPDAIFVWNQNSIIVAANNAAARMLGYERSGDLIGQSWQDFIVSEDLQVLVEDAERLARSGGITEKEFRMRRKDGAHIFVQGRLFIESGDSGNPRQAIGITRDITDRKTVETALRHQALHDSLTGLANRPAFLAPLHETFVSTRRGGEAFAVLYLDLDRFKDVNDTLNHAVGDRLLQFVATRLRGTLRLSDFTARLGGDEFAILQTHLHDPSDAGLLAAKLLKSTAAPHEIDGNEIRITASIGISVYDPKIVDPETMLHQADLALYKAKDEGRNRFCFHSSELDREVHRRVDLTNELHVGLEKNELAVCGKTQKSSHCFRFLRAGYGCAAGF